MRYSNVKDIKITILAFVVLCIFFHQNISSFFMANGMTMEERLKLKQETKQMFYHGYNHYMKHAFPMDELCPLSCTGRQSWFSQALTLIDSLDTLMIMGDEHEFLRGVRWMIQNLDFNRNVNVSVFETNIRILGGLLSAHLLLVNAEDPNNHITELDLNHQSSHLLPEYRGELLQLARTLGDKLLPAFTSTKTGIPYGMINLETATVSPDESNLTSTAGGGTHLLEFGVLSVLTGDFKYFNAADRAAKHLFFSRYQETGLLGNHIHIHSGQWSHRDSGIGANMDSYFEYLLKSYLLFGREDHFRMFQTLFQSIMKHGVYKRPWYVDVDMITGMMTWPLYTSLQGFWPGLLCQTHRHIITRARETVMAFHSVWRKYGCVPEGYNLVSGTVQPGQKGYPLRPELIESIYFLYRATRDDVYLHMGRDILKSLNFLTRVKCGFANIADVETKQLEDRMESFFLAETLKYLYLLFDEDNFVNAHNAYTFNTEGHIIPLRREFLGLGQDLAISNHTHTTTTNSKNFLQFDELQCKRPSKDANFLEFFNNLAVSELYYDSTKR